MKAFWGRSSQAHGIWEQKSRRLFRVAYAWCHDVQLASDLVQEAIARAIAHKDKFDNERSLDVWLFKVLLNCYRDHIRQHRTAMPYDETKDSHQRTPATEYETREVVGRVQQAVSSLSLDQRQVVMLVALEGFSYKEVSTILSIPIGTVMSRLGRAREALRNDLQDLVSVPTTVKGVR